MTQEVEVQVSVPLWADRGSGHVTPLAPLGCLGLRGLEKVEEFLSRCLESC